uniref:Uncharacterized protein n=1 Tax=Anguilla anguilla TaxID=7936 RepID=A0A0E9QH80_ANGAN
MTTRGRQSPIHNALLALRCMCCVNGSCMFACFFLVFNFPIFCVFFLRSLLLFFGFLVRSVLCIMV